MLSAILIVPFFVCPSFLIESNSHIILVMLFKYALPSFGLGYVLYGFSRPLVYERMGLINKEDVSDKEVRMNIG